MKLADVVFPASFAELSAMPSAELRVLVGKLENGAALHPKIASMGYHMTKAERLSFLGHHHYGMASYADDAAKALGNAEVKYAEHQAKKGVKTGAKVTGGAGPTTNCSATVAKTLASLADNVPPLVKFGADLDNWAGALIDPPEGLEAAAKIKAWKKQLTDVTGGGADLAGNELDDLLKLDQLLGDWAKALEVADTANDPFLVTASPKQLWEAAQQLKKSADDVAAMVPKTVPEAHGLAGSMQSVANTQSNTVIFDAYADLLEDAVQAQIDGLTVVGQLADALADLTPPTVEKLYTVIGGKLGPLIDSLSVDDFAALPNDLPTQLLTGLAKAKLPPDTTSKLLNALEGPVDELQAGIDNAVSAAQEAAETAAAQAATAAVQEAVSASQAVYGALSKAELKKLGPQAFKNAGVDTPSLAHYLTKDQLAEAIAKVDYGEPIDDLLAIANAKKVAHKTKGDATQAATKDPTPGDVPSLAAAPDTVDTTVLTPAQAKTKAANEAPPTTPADVEKLAVPEAGPPPDVLVDTPGPKYAKPAQVEHAFTVKAKQDALGGAHAKRQFVDEDGNVWMWKKSETKGVADGEVLAHEIGWDLGFDMADIRYASNWDIPGVASRHGTVQKFHQGVKGNMQDVPVSAMTPQQLSELQEHQVFDWLISQHDTHHENILVMADGHLAPIDKGQAFKFFGNDKLAVGYKPQGNFGDPVYYRMWDEYAAGNLDLDLDAIDNILARIDQLDDAEYEAKIRAYATQRFRDGRGKALFVRADLANDVDAFVGAVLKRKQDIRAEFTEFYKAQAKRRGETWSPLWDKRLKAAPAEAVEEAGAAAVSAGITTPITPQLATDIQRFGAGGKTLHLAGKDVNQSQALFWVEQSKAGKTILRMEARLEPGAQKRVGDLFRSLAPDAPTANATASPGYIADPLWQDVLAYAKTVGAHADDGLYNTTTVTKTKNALEGWQTKADAKKTAAQVALKEGDTETWATLQAQAEQYEHYGNAYEMLAKAQADGVKPPFPIEAFDAQKARQGWLAKAPDAPSTDTAEPSTSLFTGDVKVGADRTAIMEPAEGFQQFRRTGSNRNIHTGRHGSVDPELDQGATFDFANKVGKQYDAEMVVNGTKVKVHYRGYETTAAIPRKGLIDIELEGWDGSTDDIERMLVVLDRLGVDARLATAEDEALSYWRQLSGSFKHSVEYVNGSGTGPYGKVRATIDGIEAKVAKAGNLTPAQEAAIYREGFTETFGEAAVARAPERLSSRRNIFGEDMGFAHVDRFDLPDDLRPNWSGRDGRAGWVHGTRHLTAEHFSTFSGAEPTEALVRKIGLDTKPGAGTTSAADDLHSGGAAGTFGSPGWSGYANGNDFILGRPGSIDRRASSYAYQGDQFGSLKARDGLTSLDPAAGIAKRGSHGEVVSRGGFDFGEDAEAVVVRSKGKRDAMLADLRKMGVEEIRGRPIEERILYAQTDTQAQALIAKLAKERPEMFRPYDDLPLVKGTPEPAAPPKKKPTKAPKKKPSPAPDPDFDLLKIMEGGTSPDPDDFDLTAYLIPDDAPFGGPPTSGKLSNAFSDLSYSDELNPFDADFPSNVDSLQKTMANALSGPDGITPTYAQEQAAKAVQHALGEVSNPGDMVEVFEAAKEFGAQYHAMQLALDVEPTYLGKLNKAMDLGKGSAGSKQHMAEMLDAKSWPDLIGIYDEGPDFPGGLVPWMKDKAKKLDGAGDETPAPPPGFLLKTDQDGITPLFNSELGDKVAFSATDSTFGYVIDGVGDVTVQIADLGAKKMLLAQYGDAWHKIADLPSTASSVTAPGKGLIKIALQQVGWPGA